MSLPQANWFHDVASAMAYALANLHETTPELAPPHNDLTHFILTQQAQMPDYLRAPMKLAALGFDVFGLASCGKRFHRQSPDKRARQIAAWKNSRIGFQRDFIRYFESLTTLALYSRLVGQASRPSIGPNQTDTLPEKRDVCPTNELRAEILVIGSGPGGAITACLLAEAGRDVLLIEEGDHLPVSSCEPFSKDEMLQKYRNGGQTVALGKNKIAYVEGRCVGGGSEINSGLYHRTPPEILERWRKEFQVEALTDAELLSHFATCESDVSVSPLPHAAPLASLKLHDGARKLGWKSLEIPRWFRYGNPNSQLPSSISQRGSRQSMTETFIPRFLKAGGRLLSSTGANRIRQNGSGWLVEADHKTGGATRIASDSLFLCAGAVHTPALLRRSGITQNIGNSLQVHPTVKIVARFPDNVNSADMGVPVHQVKEFSPRLSFGCSISSPAYIALGLLDHPDAARETSRMWQKTATYYAMISSEGHGTVRSLPTFRDPFVRYSLTETDRRNLSDGLRKLSQALFAAGAKELFPSLTRGPMLRCDGCLSKIPDVLPVGLANLMTIHLFSSAPMGEDKSKCATDSFGRVHGLNNLYINDASLLCTAPGVNPQGSIMAIARRNTLKFLGRL
jgi:choline dehydrogenase-like flavoprotein